MPLQEHWFGQTYDMNETPRPYTPTGIEQSPNPSESRVHDQIAYIRDAMDAARQFTAVPGLGLVGMGVLALAASGLSLKYGAPWQGNANMVGLMIWLVALTAAMTVGITAMIGKTARSGHSFSSAKCYGDWSRG